MDKGKYPNSSWLLLVITTVFLCSCGGVREFHAEKVKDVVFDNKLDGTVHLEVATTPVYNHKLGIYEYKLHVKDAVEKQYRHALGQCFKGGVVENTGETNIVVTALDISIFPIAGVLFDIRLFFRVEIFDAQMDKQKTFTVYGFGSDSNGDRALEQAVVNSFYQLFPSLEDLFVRK